MLDIQLSLEFYIKMLQGFLLYFLAGLSPLLFKSSFYEKGGSGKSKGALS